MSQSSMARLAAFTDTLPAEIRAGANNLKISAVLAIENNLTQATPVDTGAAISNWQASLDSPRLDIIDPYAPSSLGVHSHKEHGDIGGGPINAQAAMEAARAAIAPAKPGQSIFIANNDPAIEATDVRGVSAQAEPGYVSRAITTGVDSMRRAKLIP